MSLLCFLEISAVVSLQLLSSSKSLLGALEILLGSSKIRLEMMGLLVQKGDLLLELLDDHQLLIKL